MQKLLELEIQGIAEYTKKYLTSELSPAYTYHSLAHTLDVVEAVRRLIRMEEPGKSEADCLLAAAYFHELGITNGYKDHEARSVAIARSALPRFGYSDEMIELVSKLILATYPGNSPTNLSEEIIRDADLDYLGREDYSEISMKLRHEWESLGLKTFTEFEWYKLQADFLSRHGYYTSGAKQLRSKGKEENLQKVLSLLESFNDLI